MEPNHVGLLQRLHLKKVGVAFGVAALVIVALLVASGIWEVLSGGRSVSMSVVGVGRGGMMQFAEEAADYDMAYGEAAMAPSYAGNSVTVSYGKVAMVRDGGIMPPVPSPTPASTPTESAAARKVIRNGSLSLIVKDTETTLASINGVVAGLNGFVDSSYLYENRPGEKSGSVTVRVPSASFEAAIAALKGLAVKVESEQTNAQDVTAQFVDLEAAIKNYRAEETQYQEIMKRASKIEDVLNVASRLADVRGRIEQTQGTLNYLSRQVEMSTISVSLRNEPDAEVGGIIWRPLAALKSAVNSLLSELAVLADGIIRFVVLLPVLLIKLGIIVAVIFFGWKGVRFGYRKVIAARQAA